jgi:hypothetical protein
MGAVSGLTLAVCVDFIEGYEQLVISYVHLLPDLRNKGQN